MMWNTSRVVSADGPSLMQKDDVVMNFDDGGGKVLGVLGGMGPFASAQFMARLTLLTPAARDQDHIPAVLWSDPRVPNRTQAKVADGDDPLPWLLRAIAGLRRGGRRRSGLSS